MPFIDAENANKLVCNTHSYRVRLSGGQIAGLPNGTPLTVLPNEPIKPLQLCLLANKYTQTASFVILLGRHENMEMGLFAKETVYAVAQTKPNQVFLIPETDIASLHYIQFLETPTNEYVDSVEQWACDELIGDACSAVNAGWRPSSFQKLYNPSVLN